MPRLIALVVGCLLVLIPAGGCAGDAGGDVPSSGPNDGTRDASATKRPTVRPTKLQPTVAIPPRPRDLPLDGVNPCALFTKAQLKQLGINRPPRAVKAGGFLHGAECDIETVTLETWRSYEILAVTHEGIGPWLSGRRNAEARLAEVAGFPAATYWFIGAHGTHTVDCSTSVDVADDQQLMVTVDNTSEHSFTLEQLCHTAEGIAGMAVHTLQKKG